MGRRRGGKKRNRESPTHESQKKEASVVETMEPVCVPRELRSAESLRVSQQASGDVPAAVQALDVELRSEGEAFGQVPQCIGSSGCIQ